MHNLRENYILSLNKPRTSSYSLGSSSSYVSAKLRNALPDFIRTTELTGFKRESKGRILYIGVSFQLNVSLKYCVFSHVPVYAMYFSCKCNAL